jgi:hypothetical protein
MGKLHCLAWSDRVRDLLVRDLFGSDPVHPVVGQSSCQSVVPRYARNHGSGIDGQPRRFSLAQSFSARRAESAPT